MSRVKPGKPGSAKSRPLVRSSAASDFARVWKIAQKLRLPGLELAQSFGKPSMKVCGKFVGWVKEPGILVVHCSIEWKELLIKERPELYFETPHYEGWPAVQIKLSRATAADIAEAVTRAWTEQAPKRLAAKAIPERSGKKKPRSN